MSRFKIVNFYFEYNYLQLLLYWMVFYWALSILFCEEYGNLNGTVWALYTLNPLVIPIVGGEPSCNSAADRVLVTPVKYASILAL